MSTLGKIWRARKQILEGVVNITIKRQFIETVAEYRMNICRECDQMNGECLVPGTGPCCGACGCSLKLKVRSMSTACGLVQKKQQPKWFPVLSQTDDDRLLSDVPIEEDDE